MSNPLVKLAQLRKFAPGGDSDKYLSTELRQNWKAIEAAFKKVGDSIQDPVSSVNITETITSTTFVVSTLSVTVNSTGRPIMLSIQGISDADTTKNFYVSTDGICYFYVATISGRVVMTSSLDSATVSKANFPFTVIDPSPELGTITYSVYGRVTVAGKSLYFNNSRLVAVTL